MLPRAAGAPHSTVGPRRCRAALQGGGRGGVVDAHLPWASRREAHSFQRASMPRRMGSEEDVLGVLQRAPQKGGNLKPLTPSGGLWSRGGSVGLQRKQKPRRDRKTAKGPSLPLRPGGTPSLLCQPPAGIGTWFQRPRLRRGARTSRAGLETVTQENGGRLGSAVGLGVSQRLPGTPDECLQ